MKHKLKPESLMMSYGYKPELSEGSIKPPIFQTSTFVFNSAEEGKAYFELAYGLRDRLVSEEMGLIYSRLNNPNLEILEDRLCLWDKADASAVFESGMSAISTVFLTFLKPGDLLVYSLPTYGGTAHFITHFLDSIGVHGLAFYPQTTENELRREIKNHHAKDRLKMIYLETPANPTNDLIDIEMCRRIANGFSQDEKKVILTVDNTYMGPIWSSPINHGADLIVYSATKYLGGHSDLIAGAVLGNLDLMEEVRTLRTFLGNMASPHTCWLLLRSLETLQVRMNQQAINAQKVASFLHTHDKICKVYFLGSLTEDHPDYSVFKRQYSSGGAMIAFEIKGGEKEAFSFLNNLKLIKLAVSLGGTESLAQHPASMTHAGMEKEVKTALKITNKLIRLSIGIEHYEDLISDIKSALQHTTITSKDDPKSISQLT